MSVDSSNSPTKTKWQSKADRFLCCIEEVKKEYDNDGIDRDERICSDYISKLMKRCVSLHELEKVINEAEMYDIYDKNEVYDKLVDFHIKTLNAIKTVKKWFPLKLQGSIKKLKHSAVHMLSQGIKFRELEEIFSHIDVYYRIEELKNKQMNLSTLSNILNDIERCPGVVDQDLIDGLKGKKEIIEYTNNKLNKLPKIEFIKDIEETSLRLLISDIKHHKTEIKKINELESLIKISECLKKLYTFIISEEMIHQSLDSILHQLDNKVDQMMNHLANNRESFMNTFDEYSENCCREIASILPAYIKECDLCDDQILYSFCSKLQMFVWKSNTCRLLERNEENEKTLEVCIKEAPQTNSVEYALITERLHCIRTAKQTEKRIKEKLTLYWSSTVQKLIEDKDDILEFVKESKSYFNDKTVEKQIEHLEEIITLFEKDQIESDSLSKLTREFELYNKGYTLLEAIKSINTSVELGKVYKEKVEYTWKRTAKARTSLKEKRSLRDIQMIPRIEFKKAQEFLKVFRKIDPKFIYEFTDPIQKLEFSLESLNTFTSQCNQFESQFSRGTLLSLECTKGVIQIAFERYEKLLDGYLGLEIKENSLEQLLEENELFLKAQSLLKNISFPDLRRDISSWESIIQKIKKYSNLSKDIIKLMESKMSMAEKLLMEAHKMRTFESQTSNGGKEAQSKQSKMLSIDSLKDIMKNYEIGDSEIELQDTMNYLEKVVSCYTEYKQSIDKCSSLRGLEELKSNIQKLPINIDNKIYSSIDSKMVDPTKLRSQLIKCLKENPVKLIHEINDWSGKFEKVGLKVEEWEEFINAYREELKFESDLNSLLWDKKDMNQVQDIKTKYQSHKYVKNANIECKILAAEIGAIQGVYERRLFGEEKPGRLFELSELSDIAKKCRDLIGITDSNDGEIAKKLSFIDKFIEDINKFINDRILASCNLEELNLNLERNPFGDMVNISSIVEEQKEKLNREALRHGPGSAKIRQDHMSHIKSLLEKNPVFSLAGIDLTASAKNIEKSIYDRCILKAKNYEDYSRTVFKIIQRLTGFSAISSYLKDKNFDINLIEKLFPKSKSEFQNLEDNILVSNKKKDLNSTNEVGQDATIYNYFKIFQGTLFFGLRDNKTQKKVENAEIFSCNPLPLIREFSIIPNKLLLSMSFTATEFQKYLQKTLTGDNYVVMPCWARFPQDSSAQARSYMEKNELVAFSSYCKTCKIFVLPKNDLRPEWLKSLNFYIAREDNEPIDFVCFCVYKKNVTNESIAPIVPISQPFKMNCTFYQIYCLLNNVLERIVDPNKLLQNPKVPETNEISADKDDDTISCEENDRIVNDYEGFFYSDDEMQGNRNNLVLNDRHEENIWISQSNDWSTNNKINFKKHNLLNVLQPMQGAIQPGNMYTRGNEYQYNRQPDLNVIDRGGMLNKRRPRKGEVIDHQIPLIDLHNNQQPPIYNDRIYNTTTTINNTHIQEYHQQNPYPGRKNPKMTAPHHFTTNALPMAKHALMHPSKNSNISGNPYNRNNTQYTYNNNRYNVDHDARHYVQTPYTNYDMNNNSNIRISNNNYTNTYHYEQQYDGNKNSNRYRPPE